MANTTIGFGLVLLLLGPVGYFGSDSQSPTALIPSAFGLVLVVLGIVARKDNLRKHAMHLAVMIGFVGCAVPAYRCLNTLLGDGIKLPLAFAAQAIMSVLCGVFVALCVRSFIQARRARLAKQS